MAGGEHPTEWVEDGTLWLRPAPGESAADFVKRAVRARGPLTDSEKVQLRDIFAPTLDQPAADDAA
ncbi:hypothetical protein ACFYY3_01055 [Streptomyces sp. NPDC001812]|uniref:hypothetical protein n=1 Tax=Streptomyces sp. NPDC001812 TaxID=3364611 RepID=UPI00367625A4